MSRTRRGRVADTHLQLAHEGADGGQRGLHLEDRGRKGLGVPAESRWPQLALVKVGDDHLEVSRKCLGSVLAVVKVGDDHLRRESLRHQRLQRARVHPDEVRRGALRDERRLESNGAAGGKKKKCRAPRLSDSPCLTARAESAGGRGCT